MKHKLPWKEIDGVMVPNQITSKIYKDGDIYRYYDKNNPDGLGYCMVHNKENALDFQWLEGMVSIKRGWLVTGASFPDMVGKIIYGPGCIRVYPEELITETELTRVLYD